MAFATVMAASISMFRIPADPIFSCLHNMEPPAALQKVPEHETDIHGSEIVDGWVSSTELMARNMPA